MTPLPTTGENCWHRIGVWGDRTCPELANVTHCHNCSVFAAAGRRFLDASSPSGYLEEWTTRLAAPEDVVSCDEFSVFVFRLADEWLALPIGVMVEVTQPRKPHRVPHRGGLLAGMVNIRGELHLCVHLDLLLGLTRRDEPATNPRLVVVRREAEGWVFLADAVDQVHRFPRGSLLPAPPTLSRATARVTRGIYHIDGRSIGLLDETRLFHAIAERVR